MSEPTSAGEATMETPFAASSCDVLVADDLGQTRELLIAFLRRLDPGVRIEQARNGVEALASWQKHRPRLTFLDIDMPGQNGVEVLKSIRTTNAEAFVVMVSGYASADNVRNALASGASGFIVKPYKPQRIVEVLERYRTVKGEALLRIPSINA
jgi:two-component system chemotaxis response regulator CheY